MPRSPFLLWHAIGGMALVVSPVTPSFASAPQEIRGHWINARRTVVVQIADCGIALCGTVVWSTDAAQRDAARGGTAVLNGTVVMSGLMPASNGRWRGFLFAPDLGRRVKGTLTLEGPTIRIKACDLGGLLCRSQIWSRSDTN